MKAKGRLETIVGCMSSGKSEELIRRLKRALIAGRKVAVFKPERDSRTGTEIKSRDGRALVAVAVASASDIAALVSDECAVVGIDEAQFFDGGIVAAVGGLIDRGIRVIAAGLDTDFRGEPFGVVPHLMAIADSVTKLQAVCVRCGCDATRSQLLVAPPSADLTSPDFVGGDEKYEARCLDCHTVPLP